MEDHLEISEIKCINPGCWDDWKWPLSIFMNRICTVIWMLSLIMKIIQCLYCFSLGREAACGFTCCKMCRLLLTSCGTGRWVTLYIALDLWYTKVSQTVYYSWLLAIQEGEPDCILLLTSCNTGRWVRLHCSWLAIQEGESDSALLLTCDIGRWARLCIAFDFLWYRKVSQTKLLLTCNTGQWARLYIALDFLWYRKVSQTTLLLTCDTGRCVRLCCSWLVIQEGESDCTLLLTSCDTGRWVRFNIFKKVTCPLWVLGKNEWFAKHIFDIWIGINSNLKIQPQVYMLTLFIFSV